MAELNEQSDRLLIVELLELEGRMLPYWRCEGAIWWESERLARSYGML